MAGAAAGEPPRPPGIIGRVGRAIYPGTFDPVTLGHLEIVRRGAALLGGLLVAVGVRVDKKTLFSVEERVALLREAVEGIDRVEVAPFRGLVVDFARAKGATLLLRGVRNSSDYEYEARMAVTNARLAPGIETLLLVADPQTAFLSSTLIREVAQSGGDLDAFVPPCVSRALREKGRRPPPGT